MNDTVSQPLVSVVVPVYNGGTMLARCLAAIRASDWPNFEIIVADDASTDGMTESTAGAYQARVVQLDQNQGPGVARNHGVKAARGEVVLFVDADVLVHEDTLSQAMASMQSGDNVAAVFGSYDDQPTETDFLSQYRNLYHHWNHQIANTEASTFWSGCGAIKKSAFEQAGGFHNEPAKPTVEDIELGYKVVDAGHRIILNKQMQCSHMKRWPLGNMIRTDLFQRGVPWVVLLLSYQRKSKDLNTNHKAKIATVAAAILCASLLFSLLEPRLLWIAGACTAIIVAMQWAFYTYVYKIRGPGFALLTVPAQVIFFVCCAAAIPLGFIKYLGTKRT